MGLIARDVQWSIVVTIRWMRTLVDLPTMNKSREQEFVLN